MPCNNFQDMTKLMSASNRHSPGASTEPSPLRSPSITQGDWGNLPLHLLAKTGQSVNPNSRDPHLINHSEAGMRMEHFYWLRLRESFKYRPRMKKPSSVMAAHMNLLALPCAKFINRVGRSWKFPRKSVGQLLKNKFTKEMARRICSCSQDEPFTRWRPANLRDPPILPNVEKPPAFTQIFKAQFGFKILVVQTIQGLEKSSTAFWIILACPIWSCRLEHKDSTCFQCQAAWNRGRGLNLSHKHTYCNLYQKQRNHFSINM